MDARKKDTVDSKTTRTDGGADHMRQERCNITFLLPAIGRFIYLAAFGLVSDSLSSLMKIFTTPSDSCSLSSTNPGLTATTKSLPSELKSRAAMPDGYLW